MKNIITNISLIYLPEGVQVKKITLSDGKTTINLQTDSGNGYRLPADSYVFEIKY